MRGATLNQRPNSLKGGSTGGSVGGSLRAWLIGGLLQGALLALFLVFTSALSPTGVAPFIYFAF